MLPTLFVVVGYEKNIFALQGVMIGFLPSIDAHGAGAGGGNENQISQSISILFTLGNN